jgi:saccharopine dehydrogenase-like NADP-dependent oxidoreductase
MKIERIITLFGVGKSTPYLIDYLLENSEHKGIHLKLVDRNFDKLSSAVREHPNCSTLVCDLFDEENRTSIVKESDLIISMVPARFHSILVKDCLKFEKNMITASYITDEIEQYQKEAKEKGLLFLFEMGVDPGIDHMSAMQVIDRIRESGGEMKLFESFCGGLIAPESDNNKWHYKFTWNPRNVVVAGQGGAAKFLQEGTYKYIPYHKLFRRTEFLNIGKYGNFEAYANRDSLKYRSVYKLDSVKTLYRGTIRRVGFSKAWNYFVQLGMTDDTYQIEDSKGMSYRDFTNLFLPYSPTDSVELKLRHYLRIEQDDSIWEKLVSINIFDSKSKIEQENGTPAQILQEILTKSWTLDPEDKDMLIMYHQFGYQIEGEMKQVESSMVVIGENAHYTAMAKTVGLPLGIAALLVLDNEIPLSGIELPIHKCIYEPVLKILEEKGIVFTETDKPYLGYNPNLIGL